MERAQFDALAKLVASRRSRRSALASLLGAVLLGRAPDADAAKRLRRKGTDKGKRKARGNGKDQNTAKGKNGGQGQDRSSRQRRGQDRAQPAEAEATRCCSTGNCAPGKGKNLQLCCYQGQNLSGKNFQGANLGSANFSGATLTNANLLGANAGKACFVDAVLTGVKTNGSTNLGGAIFCRTQTDTGENNSGCGQGTPCCPTCDDDDDCGGGQVCCAGRCVRGACCTAADCATRTCQNTACVGRQCVYSPISGTTGPDCASICCDGACVPSSSACGGICGNVCTSQETCCGEKCVPIAALCGGICDNICAAGDICCGEKCTPAKLLCGGACENTCPGGLTCCGEGRCQQCCGSDVSTCKPAGVCAQVTCENGACAYATDKDGTPCEAGKGTCCDGKCIPTETLCGGICGNVCSAPRPNCCGQSCQECCTDAQCLNSDEPFCLSLQCVDEHVVNAFERVRTVVANVLNIDEDRITMESRFIEDLGADSLDLVELVMEMEEEFGLEISDEDAEKIRTVGEAVRYIVANGG